MLAASVACGGQGAERCAVTDTRLSSEEDSANGLGLPGEGVLRYEFDVTLEPASEVFWCYFGTFEETVAINGLSELPQSQYLHHQLIKTAPEDSPHEDGEVVNCPSLSWYETAPTLLERPGGWQPTLPTGVAYVMDPGQRFVIDSHWINPTVSEQIAHVGVDLYVTDYEDVEYEAGSFFMDLSSDEVDVLPGPSSLSFDCAFEEAVNLLQVAPHMHG